MFTEVGLAKVGLAKVGLTVFCLVTEMAVNMCALYERNLNNFLKCKHSLVNSILK